MLPEAKCAIGANSFEFLISNFEFLQSIRDSPRTPKGLWRGSRTGLVPPGIATVATAAPAIAGTTVPAAAAAAFATVTAATTAAAASIFVAAAPAAAKAATTALIARAGFVDAKGASIYLLAIKLAYSVLCIGFGSHGHKGESAGLAREFILHEQHFGHSASLRKHVLQLEFRCRERQVAYVQSISHISNRFGFSLQKAAPVRCGRMSLKRLQ